jgi:hypothetical protein
MTVRKRTQKEIEESRAFHERVLANAERTRKLAEKAQAELDRRKQQRESA